MPWLAQPQPHHQRESSIRASPHSDWLVGGRGRLWAAGLSAATAPAAACAAAGQQPVALRHVLVRHARVQRRWRGRPWRLQPAQQRRWRWWWPLAAASRSASEDMQRGGATGTRSVDTARMHSQSSGLAQGPPGLTGGFDAGLHCTVASGWGEPDQRGWTHRHQRELPVGRRMRPPTVSPRCTCRTALSRTALHTPLPPTAASALLQQPPKPSGGCGCCPTASSTRADDTSGRRETGVWCARVAGSPSALLAQLARVLHGLRARSHTTGASLG